MLGSMGVQGAVQVMHTTIPMEWTPNMGELQARLYSELAVALGVKFAQVAYAISQLWLVIGGSRLLTSLPARERMCIMWGWRGLNTLELWETTHTVQITKHMQSPPGSSCCDADLGKAAVPMYAALIAVTVGL